MIQRIQSLYLLAATSIMTIFFSATLATFNCDLGLFSLKAAGIVDVEGVLFAPTAYLIFITGLATLLPLVTIFLFKKRMLQLRLCVVEIILAIGVLIIEGVYYYLGSRSFDVSVLGDATSSISIAAALPIAVIIFSYLALRGIFKDEMLVKSLDRIR